MRGVFAHRTLGHLSDDELVDFLRTCREALRSAAADSCFTAGASPAILNSSSSSSHRRSEEQNQQQEKEEDVPTFERDGGLIIVKENIYVSPSDPDGDNFIFDQVDSSVTRSVSSFYHISPARSRSSNPFVNLPCSPIFILFFFIYLKLN
jgi:hypothetical protein